MKKQRRIQFIKTQIKIELSIDPNQKNINHYKSNNFLY